MTAREEFRGDYRDRFVVRPIDPERPHRFVEQAVGRAGVCYFCGRWKVSDYHDDAAKQMTVDIRPGANV